MPRLTGRSGAVFGLVCSAVLLYASISVGLRVPGTTFLNPFGSSGSLDYRALHFGRFSPLRGEFIASELGSVIEDEEARLSSPSLRREEESTLRSLTADPLTVTHGFTNDDFGQAFGVRSIPFTARTNTAQASRQQTEPATCAGSGGTAWYRYRSPRAIGLLANTFGSTYSTALGVFVGPDLSNLRRIACDTDTSGFAQVAFPASEGETYWFQISAPSGGGRLVFNLTLKGVTTLGSASASGRQGDANSVLPTISGDGRFVSFYGASSFAGYEPPPPCQRSPSFDVCRPAVFLRDRKAHRIVRVDEVPAADPLTQALNFNGTNDQSSITGSISGDGRFVAFWSGHTRLVRGDTNDTWDVFVKDRDRATVRRVSVSSSGSEGNGPSYNGSISADGRYVAFTSTADNLVENDTNVAPDVFLRDLQRSTTTRVSVSSSGRAANLLRSRGYPLEAGSHLIALSANGRFVLFRSTASNLVPGDMNGFADIFVRDLLRRTTTRVSVSSDGAEADADSRQPVGIAQGAVSNDGRYAFFNSDASNLVPDDTNGQEDLFLRDTVTRATERVSVSSTGAQSNRGVGASDPFAAFTSTFTQLTVEPQNLSQVAYSATPDGRYVAFSSDATNLVPGDRNAATDIFLRDLRTQNTTIVSLSSTGAQANGASNSPALSADGRFIVYRSAASNLVPADNNGYEDVFVYEIPGQHELSGWH